MNLIKEAEDIILKRKTEAENKAVINYNNSLKIVEIKDIEKVYNSLLPKYSRLEAFNLKDEKLEEKYVLINQKRKEILKKYNINQKDFKPAYSCKKCNDTGYINGKMCICLKQEINNLISIKFGMGKEYNSFNKNNFNNNDIYKKQLSKIYDNIIKYCENFPDTKYKSLIFTGLSGTGKTYLASCIANSISQKGCTVILITAFKLNEIFLKYHIDFKGDGRDYIENLNNCDLLIIDDLGTENTLKNVTNEYLLSLISERLYNNKHTLVTTNLNGEQLRQKYDDRLYSRLTDKNKTYIFNFKGQDLRQVK